MTAVTSLEREERKLMVLRERARSAEREWRAVSHARRTARMRAEIRWRMASEERERQQSVVDRLRAAGPSTELAPVGAAPVLGASGD